MKFFTLALAILALALPATLLMTSTSNAGLLVDRNAGHVGPSHVKATNYAAR